MLLFRIIFTSVVIFKYQIDGMLFSSYSCSFNFIVIPRVLNTLICPKLGREADGVLQVVSIAKIYIYTLAI